MKKKELRKAFEEGLINQETYKEELFKIETAPKVRKVGRKFPTCVSIEDYELIQKYTLKKHHKLAFALGFLCGLRVGEIVSLEPRDINFKEKVIDIREGKGWKDRTVPLPKGFRESMLQYLPLKCGIRSLQIAFKLTVKRAGLLEKKPGMHFHSLRHGFATTALSKGMPIHHLRTLMGHANISTTNIYLERNPIDAIKSYNDIF